MSRRSQAVQPVDNPAHLDRWATAGPSGRVADADVLPTESPTAFGPVVLGRPGLASGGVVGAAQSVLTTPRQGTVVVVTAVGSA
jgi:hypothetical protein